MTWCGARRSLPASGELITASTLNLPSLEQATGAAPAGTSLLGAVGLSARDAQGRRIYDAPGGLRVEVTVEAGDVLPGTLSGDLKAAAWDATARRWVLLPAQVRANADGSFTVTTTVDFYGVVATLYAPGAGRIAAFPGYSAEGAGLGVFSGGRVDVLANAAGLNQADGAWVQDDNGVYRLLVIGGPAFLARDFETATPERAIPQPRRGCPADRRRRGCPPLPRSGAGRPVARVPHAPASISARCRTSGLYANPRGSSVGRKAIRQ